MTAQTIDGAWSAARKNEVASAFHHSDAPFAEDAWRETARTIDDYVGAWSTMRTSVCQATRVRHEQSSDQGLQLNGPLVKSAASSGRID